MITRRRVFVVAGEHVAAPTRAVTVHESVLRGDVSRTRATPLEPARAVAVDPLTQNFTLQPA